MGTWRVAAAGCLAAVLFLGCELSHHHSSDTSTPSVVTLSPLSVTLSATEVNSVQFTASGGDSNYVWSLSDPSLGTLLTNSPSTAVYQNWLLAGTNTLTLADSGFESAGATIIQVE